MHDVGLTGAPAGGDILDGFARDEALDVELAQQQLVPAAVEADDAWLALGRAFPAADQHACVLDGSTAGGTSDRQPWSGYALSS